MAKSKSIKAAGKGRAGSTTTPGGFAAAGLPEGMRPAHGLGKPKPSSRAKPKRPRQAKEKI